MKFSTKTRAKLLGIVLLFIVATLIQILLSARIFHPDRVTIWVFNVGQGDAIFIDAPEAQVLIDGGPDQGVLEKLSMVMPFWDRSIDLVINTHPHADHVTGLTYVLDRYRVEEVWTGGQDYGTETFGYFEHQVSPMERVVQRGETFSLGRDAELEVVWPFEEYHGLEMEDPNDGSVSALLTFGETTMLLTGDIGIEEEANLIPYLPQIDILKVGHHGSRTSSGGPFLEVIRPAFAIISTGENDYGHPHEIVLDRLQEMGAAVLRTDQDGDIRIISDGGEPSLASFDL